MHVSRMNTSTSRDTCRAKRWLRHLLGIALLACLACNSGPSWLEALAAASRRAALASALTASFAETAKAAAVDPGRNVVRYEDNLKMTELPNGLKYADVRPGKGESPKPGTKVTIDYVMMTTGARYGTKIDSTKDREQPYSFVLGDPSIISGLSEAVSTMQPGGIRRVIIPQSLGLPFSDLPLETVVKAVLKAKPASAGKGRDAYAAPIAADEMPQIFRKVLLELQLHVEDEASLLWLCRMLDVNGDGVVTLYEIASMLPMVCGGEAVANERYLFKMTDENGDNYLSKKEFSNYLTPFLSWVCAKCDLSKSATLPDLVAKVVFSKIDTNQDGFISPEEWTSWSAQFNLFTEVYGRVKATYPSQLRRVPAFSQHLLEPKSGLPARSRNGREALHLRRQMR
eukprot:s786_g10.t1